MQLRIAEQDCAACALGVARVVRLGYEDGAPCTDHRAAPRHRARDPPAPAEIAHRG
ncbi:MAG: hypothetical protein U0232_12475 [Thermomicrobiales bacterium]